MLTTVTYSYHRFLFTNTIPFTALGRALFVVEPVLIVTAIRYNLHYAYLCYFSYAQFFN